MTDLNDLLIPVPDPPDWMTGIAEYVNGQIRRAYDAGYNFGCDQARIDMADDIADAIEAARTEAWMEAVENYDV